MKKSLILWFLSLCLSTPAGADVIRLQSGQTREGKIIERTAEYIKLENKQGTYRIPVKMIEEESTESLQDYERPREIVTDKNMNDWEEWMKGQKEYRKKVEQLQQRLSELMSESAQKANAALQNQNVKAGAKTVQEARAKIVSLKKELQRIAPPAELVAYQQKIMESFEYTVKSMDFWLIADQQAYYLARKYSVRAFIEALEEWRDTNRRMGASPGYVDVMNVSIENYKKRLKKAF